MSSIKASLFRRVAAWAATADQATLDGYIGVLHERMDKARDGMAKAFRLALICAAALELVLAAAVGQVTVGPVAVTDFKLVALALPGVIAFLSTSAVLAGHVLAYLQVSEAACVDVRYRTESLLGIDFPLRSIWSIQDWHLGFWGQPAGRRAEQASAWLRRIYLWFAAVAVLLYAPTSVVRSGVTFRWSSIILWTSAFMSVVGLLRVLLLARHGRGLWELDEHLPPAAHLMSDEQISEWQRTFRSHPPPSSSEDAPEAGAASG